MKVSTKGRYGLRALVDLAVREKDGHVTLISLAQHNNLPMHYMEHVFSSLKNAGIVKSQKGSQGGYVLGDKAENITIARILYALEGSFKVEGEQYSETSEYKDISIALDILIWDRVNDNVTNLLETTTLEDLKSEYIRRTTGQSDIYYI